MEDQKITINEFDNVFLVNQTQLQVASVLLALVITILRFTLYNYS